LKYGKILHGRYEGMYYKRNQFLYSYGDAVQSLAIENVFNFMGIYKSDITDIQDIDVKNYCGDKLILPLTGYIAANRRVNVFPLPDSILPVYFSFKHSLPRMAAHAIGGSAIIGCRDIYLRDSLRQLGRNAYMSGCATLTFPKRADSNAKSKVFCVDTPSDLDVYMPESLKKDCEYISHRFVSDQNISSVQFLEDTQKLFNRYRDEARLVVTSLFHAAVPCMAMGIPVIFVLWGSDIDSRLSAVDPFLPIYTKDTVNQIDWNPEPVDCEPIKMLTLNAFSDALREPNVFSDNMKELDSFYSIHAKASHLRRDTMLKKIQLGMMYYTPKTASFIRYKVTKGGLFKNIVNNDYRKSNV
jgi:hypothetical protein